MKGQIRRSRSLTGQGSRSQDEKSNIAKVVGDDATSREGFCIVKLKQLTFTTNLRTYRRQEAAVVR